MPVSMPISLIRHVAGDVLAKAALFGFAADEDQLLDGLVLEGRLVVTAAEAQLFDESDQWFVNGFFNQDGLLGGIGGQLALGRAGHRGGGSGLVKGRGTAAIDNADRARCLL
jgi:hypothetical protein